MKASRRWARRHELAAECIIAGAFFALGPLSVRVYHDIGATRPHNFRFASGVAVTALLTMPLAL